MIPYLEPNEFIEIDSGGKERKFYVVDKVEDLIYDYRSYGTVATVTLGTYTQITDLEPKQCAEPESQLYHLHTGINIGMFFVEILAGNARRGTFKVPKPTSSNYYVGYENEITSPQNDPRYEFFLRYNEIPALSVYNPWGFTITPYFYFKGKKYKIYDISHKNIGEYMYFPNIDQIKQSLETNELKHKRIILRGLYE